MNENIYLLQCYDDLPDESLGQQEFEMIAQCSNDQDAFVRSLAAEQLIRFSKTRWSQQAQDVLLRLAKDSSSSVRTEAYDSLSEYHTLEVVAVLAKAMEQESDEVARSYASAAWAEVQQGSKSVTEVCDVLHRHLAQETSDVCKLSCAYGLCLLGEEGALPQLLFFLKHRDYHLRCAALNDLELLLDSNAVENKKSVIAAALDGLLECENVFAVRETARELYQNHLEL